MKTDNTLVSIIILNYNAGRLLLDCVESILQSNYKNYEIIVVDNLSNDESHKKCKEKFGQVILVENTKNLGYCEGNNVGIRIAKGDFLVILNPDTIVESDWLDQLLSAYSIFGEGLYQPKILATTDHRMLLSTGQMLNPFGFGYSRSKGEEDRNQFENFEQINYASGTCLFTSTKTMNDLGMFDSFLFAYHDDLDLGWRAMERGLKSHYVPKAVIYHPIEGYSFKWSKFKFYLLERNRHYCILTHYSRITLIKMLPALILVDMAVLFFYLSRGMIKEKIKAYCSIMRNIRKINQRYTEIQQLRKVSDKTLIQQFSDEVLVPKWVANNFSNRSFNSFITKLSKTTKFFI